jgi:predicted transcriptional regulator
MLTGMARTKDDASKKMRTVSARISEDLYKRLQAIAEADATHTISRKRPTISELMAVAAEDLANRYDKAKKK